MSQSLGTDVLKHINMYIYIYTHTISSQNKFRILYEYIQINNMQCYITIELYVIIIVHHSQIEDSVSHFQELKGSRFDQLHADSTFKKYPDLGPKKGPW